MTQRVAFAQRLWSWALSSMRPLEQPYLETFLGAARCQVTELTPGKAAPLQVVGSADRRGRFVICRLLFVILLGSYRRDGQLDHP